MVEHRFDFPHHGVSEPREREPHSRNLFHLPLGVELISKVSEADIPGYRPHPIPIAQLGVGGQNGQAFANVGKIRPGVGDGGIANHLGHPAGKNGVDEFVADNAANARARAEIITGPQLGDIEIIGLLEHAPQLGAGGALGLGG